jgi:K+-sensing histidine kinase KdpD
MSWCARWWISCARRAAARDACEEQRKAPFVGVSHDLRTPLTSLQLLVSAMRDDVASPEKRERYAGQMLARSPR